jgi:hypothetical protein
MLWGMLHACFLLLHQLPCRMMVCLKWHCCPPLLLKQKTLQQQHCCQQDQAPADGPLLLRQWSPLIVLLQRPRLALRTMNHPCCPGPMRFGLSPAGLLLCWCLAQLQGGLSPPCC